MIGTRGMPTSYGGVERAVEELSVRLVEAGHDVTVYCRSQYVRERLPEWRGVKLRYLPCLPTKHLEAISHTVLATLDVALRRVDVVHFHATGPSLLAPLARMMNKRVVVTVQGLDFRRKKWGLVARTALKLGAFTASRAPHRTIVVSRELQEYFFMRHGRSTDYIPNGVVEPSHRQPAPAAFRSEGYALFLGRLVPEKRVHDLIAAFARTTIDLDLVIAGPSSHSTDYVAQLELLAGGDPRIHLVGPVYGDAKDALIQHAHLFCQPSELEGLPIALLEAMACGVCPVVSDIPPHLEILGAEAEAGFVFRTGDVGDLRSTLELATNQSQETARRARAARDVASRYDWEVISRQVQAVYLDLVGDGQGDSVHARRPAGHG